LHVDILFKPNFRIQYANLFPGYIIEERFLDYQTLMIRGNSITGIYLYLGQKSLSIMNFHFKTFLIIINFNFNFISNIFLKKNAVSNSHNRTFTYWSTVLEQGPRSKQAHDEICSTVPVNAIIKENYNTLLPWVSILLSDNPWTTSFMVHGQFGPLWSNILGQQGPLK